MYNEKEKAVAKWLKNRKFCPVVRNRTDINCQWLKIDSIVNISRHNLQKDVFYFKLSRNHFKSDIVTDMFIRQCRKENI